MQEVRKYSRYTFLRIAGFLTFPTADINFSLSKKDFPLSKKDLSLSKKDFPLRKNNEGRVKKAFPV
ncbi:hypothetical protein TPHV1_280009 [Treponema phagedenis]|uniref:Uncharacterized protein n=1 Tax=Treponema phagedenis TaxID=162 RepID=A0A0B7GWY8_TREPH|nr:hypothetical protein TPHV1_280009 [Treponema phagedenis]